VNRFDSGVPVKPVEFELTWQTIEEMNL
jgi:hypothetical protein